ncbi:MAG: hypothetical protein E4H01_14400 [Lysobacterales bacterium]|nr:MAG: hypothetical protein E4H01_14400 [Xanthomonadales bacterium]
MSAVVFWPPLPKLTHIEQNAYNLEMMKFEQRVAWNWRHFFDFKSFNPYVARGEGDSTPKHRTGMQDITHSLKNLLVEGRRLKESIIAGRKS